MVTAFVLADAFVAAHRTIGWVVACAIVALLIDPVVDLVHRVMPRWLAVIVVLIGLLAVIGAVAAGLASDLADSLEELKESAPVAAADLEQQHDVLADVNLAQRVQDFVDEMDDRVRSGRAVDRDGDVPCLHRDGHPHAVPPRLRPPVLRRFRRAVARTPPGDRANASGGQAALRGRRYLLIVLAHSVVNGVVVGLVCWWIGVPAAIALGFAVGALTAIPLIGVLVGGIPAALLAFGLEDWAGFVVVGVLVALQVIEAAAVRPAVDTRTVRVGPTVAVVVALLGFELYGVGGAVYGVALAVIALAALDELGRMRGDPAALAIHGERPEQRLQQEVLVGVSFERFDGPVDARDGVHERLRPVPGAADEAVAVGTGEHAETAA